MRRVIEIASQVRFRIELDDCDVREAARVLLIVEASKIDALTDTRAANLRDARQRALEGGSKRRAIGVGKIDARLEQDDVGYHGRYRVSSIR